jgi:hypothetical protein
MPINSQLDTVILQDDLVVFGPPSIIDIGVDIGPKGDSGSQFFVGTGNPNNITIEQFESLYGILPSLNDLFLRVDIGEFYGTFYRYSSVPGAEQWEIILELIEVVDLFFLLNESFLILPRSGGTGVNNGTSTITIGGNFRTLGEFPLDFSLSGSTSLTLPTSGSVTVKEDKLNVFSPTTSSELASVITDETGTGQIVFNASPSIDTSLTTTSTTFELLNSNATTINFAGEGTNVNVGSTTGQTTVRNNLFVDGNASISGNLLVSGSATIIDVEKVVAEDPVITLGGDSDPVSPDGKDRGIEFRWHNGVSPKVGFFGFDNLTQRFTFVPDATNTDEKFSGTLGDFDINNLYAIGLISASGGFTGDLTGNAETATKLATARAIELAGDVSGSASFDGSGSVSISATIQPDSVALGTDTTGDYVQSVTGSGDGISVTGTGEGALVTVSNTGVTSLVGTADQVTVSASSGSVTLSLPSTIDVDISGNAQTVSAVPARVINQKTDSYTLQLADAQNILEFNSASAMILTIPEDSSVNFPVGSYIDVVQTGDAEIEVEGTGIVTLLSKNSETKTSGQYSRVYLYKQSSNSWILTGNLSS